MLDKIHKSAQLGEDMTFFQACMLFFSNHFEAISHTYTFDWRIHNLAIDLRNTLWSTSCYDFPSVHYEHMKTCSKCYRQSKLLPLEALMWVSNENVPSN